MIILGIDPGFAIVGYGVIEKNGSKCTPIDYGVITTTPKDTFPVRLFKIENAMEELVAKFRPQEIAIEELFFARNVTTAIDVAQARGVIVASSMRLCGNIFEYTPLQIKQAITGYGRADKNQIQQMVKAMLNLAKIPKPDDAADALAVALCHAQTNQLMSNFAIK